MKKFLFSALLPWHALEPKNCFKGQTMWKQTSKDKITAISLASILLVSFGCGTKVADDNTAVHHKLRSPTVAADELKVEILLKDQRSEVPLALKDNRVENSNEILFDMPNHGAGQNAQPYPEQATSSLETNQALAPTCQGADALATNCAPIPDVAFAGDAGVEGYGFAPPQAGGLIGHDLFLPPLLPFDEGFVEHDKDHKVNQTKIPERHQGPVHTVAGNSSGEFITALVTATGQNPNGDHGDHLIIVNATGEQLQVKVEYTFPYPDRDWDKTFRSLDPGGVTTYAFAGNRDDYLFALRPRQLIAIHAQVPETSAVLDFVTLAKPYGGLFVITKKQPGPTYVATGPYYDRGSPGTSIGTLYMVNATGYTVNFHSGYLSLFCKDDNIKLLPDGQVRQLNIGACETTSIYADVLLPDGRTAQTNHFGGHTNNGAFVFREKLSVPGQFEVVGTFDFYFR